MQKITLILTFSLSILLASDASPLERVKRQNLQGLLVPQQFQNINIENYLKNPRAVQFQLKCVIYDGPCDSIGKYLKANFPKWLATQCKNCPENQKKQAGKTILFFQNNYPKEWNDGVKKYRGTFTDEDIRRFETELGIKVEAQVPTGPTRKPDSAGLAALAKEALAAAKTTAEPLIFEERPKEEASPAPVSVPTTVATILSSTVAPISSTPSPADTMVTSSTTVGTSTIVPVTGSPIEPSVAP